ncbi:hypothetical protein PPYR_13925 [Photinus pyralis]|uniref:DDE Tnp4 domain-containing protein n=2 Tax=Photinus pyralis TaxID=7054 RepID=A0A5N4A3P7_PHOPY|nr:putative nuclease HARBI1 [Photinus pyralis]KAB0791964.1 hypothetical protein PPYR_13925 [Photinus pyralis]
MVEYLLPEWIVFPQTDAKMNELKERFMEQFQFPGIIGAIDCTHVAIKAPPQDHPVNPGLAYYNRKGYYSINVQLICDANLRVLNCNARFPGAVHDSAIWSLSQVRHYLQRMYSQGQLQSTWLIGDSGYPLEPWLLTPTRASKIILSAVILHNLALNDRLPDSAVDDDHLDEPLVIQQEQRVQNVINEPVLNEARRIRNRVIQQYFR